MSYHVNEKAITVNLEPTFLKCYTNVEELQQYLKNHCRAFKQSFFLKDYVGRPTPLYFRSLSQEYNTKVYL
jgi:tryptophan synthase beta subunit